MLRVMLLTAGLCVAAEEARVPDPADGRLLRSVHDEVLRIMDRMTAKRAALEGLASRYGSEAEFPALEIERRILSGEVETLLAELVAKEEELQERIRRHTILRGALMVANMGAGDRRAAEGDAQTVLEYDEARREVTEFIRATRVLLAEDAEAFAAGAERRAERARSRARARAAAGIALALAAAALFTLRRRRRAAA